MAIFVVQARRTPEVLGRVVLLFHRLAIEIDGLTLERRVSGFVLANPEMKKSLLETVRITIKIEGHSEKLGRIEANLYKIVDVLSVKTMPDGASFLPHAMEKAGRSDK